MGELLKLSNIGKILEEQLNKIGISNYKQLETIGSKQAWLNIKAIDPSACYNRLCALEGAIRGIRWYDLPTDIKKDLKEFYHHFK